MAKSNRDEHHVVPRDEKGWAIERTGNDKASGIFDTKKEAVDAAREISKNQGTELVIHKQDGTIQNKDSHGNDPNPPKDKK